MQATPRPEDDAEPMTDQVRQADKSLVLDYWAALDNPDPGERAKAAAAVASDGVRWHGHEPVGSVKGSGRREGDQYVQNWVFVDMVHLFGQMGVDLFERMRAKLATPQAHGGAR